MARTTRSSANADQQPPKALPTTSKKRKRTSVAAEDNHPANKQPRTDEEQTDPDTQEVEQSSSYVGDTSLDPTTANKILDILEVIDTQGLLDRVFPLQTINPFSPVSHSFRNLLSDSSQHSLSTLRSAVHHLFPLSSQPRSKRSAPATQQLHFCNLALSLLDQASRQSAPIVPDLASLFAQEGATEETSDDISKPSSSTSDVPQPRKLRYALVQHLPSTDWWTSLNSELALSDAYKLTELGTANANLVAVLPTPVTGANASSSSVPTLGSYNRASTVSSHSLPVGRKVSAGTFLDYGVYASFAPTFEQEGRVVGRNQIAEVIWTQTEKRRQRGRRGRIPVSSEVEDITMTEDSCAVEAFVQKSGADSMEVYVDETLGELLPPEDIAEIKSVLETEALEQAVEELLERNKRALQRLQELQFQRLIQEGGEKSSPKEGSEEWDTAHSILDSLTLLTSLRPQSSTDGSSIAPPPSVLRKLSRSLPSEQLPNWQGTLPPSNPTSLRDDTTIKIKPFQPTTTVLPPATPVAPAVSTPTYSGYPYNAAYPNYRSTAGYTPYGKGTQTTAYGNSTPYGSSSYYQNYQGNYSYTPWYTSYSGANSGRATPQVGTQSPAPMASSLSYSSIPNAQTQQQRVPAVANTIASHNDAGGGQQVAPTLPPYLRTTTTTSTSQQMNNGTSQGYQYGQSPILS